MSYIERRFHQLKGREGVLIGYVTGGFPSPEKTMDVVEALVEGGTDIVELGVPFSDPIADGPVIQETSKTALSLGTTPLMVLKMAKKVKERFDVPVAIITYLNPVLKVGLQSFLDTASDSEVDGVIIPDLPFDESTEYITMARMKNIDTIFLASPSTQEERLDAIVNVTRGFLYLVSVYGVTGIRQRVEELTTMLVKTVFPHTSGRTNLAVGFGISRAEHVKTVLQSGADGAIVGSALMNILLQEDGFEKKLHDVEALTSELKNACRPQI